MLRSRRHRLLLVAPIALALLLVAPALASADDDAPEPKRVRIKVEKKAEHATPAANPMEILHHWFAGHLQKDAPGGEGLEARLKTWFAAGKDAPMAGLRDAFKAHGWDAAKLSQWLSGHAASAVRGVFAPGLMGASKGPHGNGMRSFAARGPTMHGWFAAPGMGHGPMMGRGFTQGGHAQGGACPQCGASPHGRGARAHTGFGPMPSRGGPMMERRGMRRGPFGMRGFRRGGPAGMGNNPFGGGMRAPGVGGKPFAGHPFAGHGMPGRTHASSRAFIMWNDGNGWQRRELAPGAGFGALPFGGNAHGFGMRQGPAGHGAAGHAPAGHGHAGHAPAPAPGHAPGGMDLKQLEKVLEMLKSMKQGAGKPGAAGQPGMPGSAGGMSAEHLQRIMEMLNGLREQGGNVTIEGAPGDMSSYLELFRRLQPGTNGAEPKRVRIKVSEPKKVEKVIEEVEVK